MAAQPITKSQIKLRTWEISRARDKQARVIMEREGISFSDAYLRVLGGGK